jgi:hypothetical protein
VFFQPKGQGLRRAKVIIRTNAPDSPYTFHIQGRGIQQGPD